MNITFNNFKTIGYDRNYQQVLTYKIGQRKIAIEELSSYFNRFNEFYRLTCDMLTEDEYLSFNTRFNQEARQKAIEFIKEMDSQEIGTFYNNRLFTYLPK